MLNASRLRLKQKFHEKNTTEQTLHGPTNVYETFYTPERSTTDVTNLPTVCWSSPVRIKVVLGK